MTHHQTPRCAGQECSRSNICAVHVKPITGWVDQYKPDDCKKYKPITFKPPAKKIIKPMRKTAVKFSQEDDDMICRHWPNTDFLVSAMSYSRAQIYQHAVAYLGLERIRVLATHN